MCPSLKKIRLPKYCISDLGRALNYCPNLEKICVSPGTSALSFYEGYSTPPLSSIVLPSSIESLYPEFKGLTNIQCYATTPPSVDESRFLSQTNIKNGILYVPKGCAQAYWKTDGWRAFKDIKETLDICNTLSITVAEHGIVTFRNEEIRIKNNVSYSGQRYFDISSDENVELNIIPNQGYAISQITIDGQIVDIPKDGKLNVGKIKSKTNVSVEFEEKKMPNANSITEFYNLGKNYSEILVEFPLTVTHVSNPYCYVIDSEGTPGLIYGTTPYKDLDIIPAGWKGKYSPYNGLPEIVPTEDMPASSVKGTFAPRTCRISDITEDMVNEVVNLEDVVFKETTPSAKASFMGYSEDGKYSITFRNQLMTESVSAGTYDVKAVVSIYGTTVQVYPIEYYPKSSNKQIAYSVKEFFEIANGDEDKKITIGFPLTVTHNYIFNEGLSQVIHAVDHEGNYSKILAVIEDCEKREYEYLDIIPAGWEATYNDYTYAIAQYENYNIPASSGKGTYEPLEIKISELNPSLNHAVVILKDVVINNFEPDGYSYCYSLSGTRRCRIYDLFSCPPVQPGTYDVKCVIDYYNPDLNNEPKINPIEFIAKSGISDALNDGVEETGRYNLLGVPVSKDYEGTVIVKYTDGSAIKLNNNR